MHFHASVYTNLFPSRGGFKSVHLVDQNNFFFIAGVAEYIFICLIVFTPLYSLSLGFFYPSNTLISLQLCRALGRANLRFFSFYNFGLRLVFRCG